MSEPDHDAPPSEAPVTGDHRVDEALRALDDLDAAPVDEHAERLTTAHAALQEVLRQPLEEPVRPGPPPAPQPGSQPGAQQSGPRPSALPQPDPPRPGAPRPGPPRPGP